MMLSESCSSSPCRSMILFTFGCVLALVLITFQYEHKLRLFNSPRFILNRSSLSLILTCGFGAALVGVLYPMMIRNLKMIVSFHFDQSSLRKSEFCKSVVIFVGINHLCAKIPFGSDLQFTLTLAIFCVAFWWWFDKTLFTFLFSVFTSLFLTLIIEILLRAGAIQYQNSDFYLKTCVSCLTFAGAILTIQLTKLLCSPLEFQNSNNSSQHREHLKTQ